MTSALCVTVVGGLAMALAVACRGASVSTGPSASDPKSPPIAEPTAPQDPAMALSASPPSLADFNHAQKLCNGRVAQATARGGTLSQLSQPHALTAKLVADYMSARGISPAPWATVAPADFVAECDFVTATDPPASCFGPGSVLVTDRVAVDDTGRQRLPATTMPVTSDPCGQGWRSSVSAYVVGQRFSDR